jgi:hypothetical protein
MNNRPFERRPMQGNERFRGPIVNESTRRALAMIEAGATCADCKVNQARSYSNGRVYCRTCATHRRLFPEQYV